jgi:hypothetical protein
MAIGVCLDQSVIETRLWIGLNVTSELEQRYVLGHLLRHTRQ